jgi:hypothetical protein
MGYCSLLIQKGGERPPRGGVLSPFSTWSGNESTGGRIYRPKCLDAYPLPWVSDERDLPDGARDPNHGEPRVTNAAIAPSLGRNLAACGNILGGRLLKLSAQFDF